MKNHHFGFTRISKILHSRRQAAAASDMIPKQIGNIFLIFEVYSTLQHFNV